MYTENVYIEYSRVINMQNSKTVRKNIIFPEKLISRFNAVNGESGMNFSTFVRIAMEEKIEHLEKLKLEKKLAEGYAANANLDRVTCNDFKFVNGENI